MTPVVSRIPLWFLLQFLPLGPFLVFLPWLSFVMDYSWDINGNKSSQLWAVCCHAVCHSSRNTKSSGLTLNSRKSFARFYVFLKQSIQHALMCILLPCGCWMHGNKHCACWLWPNRLTSAQNCWWDSPPTEITVGLTPLVPNARLLKAVPPLHFALLQTFSHWLCQTLACEYTVDFWMFWCKLPGEFTPKTAVAVL